jgi:hypothetical protein
MSSAISEETCNAAQDRLIDELAVEWAAPMSVGGISTVGCTAPQPCTRRSLPHQTVYQCHLKLQISQRLPRICDRAAQNFEFIAKYGIAKRKFLSPQRTAQSRTGRAGVRFGQPQRPTDDSLEVRKSIDNGPLLAGALGNPAALIYSVSSASEMPRRITELALIAALDA